MTTMTPEDLHAVMRARKVAMMRYERAIRQARAEGWSNTDIARAVGLSEAAIRLYWLRNPEDREVVTASQQLVS